MQKEKINTQNKNKFFLKAMTKVVMHTLYIFQKGMSFFKECQSSSVPWPCLIIGSLHNWSPDQFLPYIWVESWCGICSCMACLGQVDLVESILPHVKAQPISTKLKMVTAIWLLIPLVEASTETIDFSFESTAWQCHVIIYWLHT